MMMRRSLVLLALWLLLAPVPANAQQPGPQTADRAEVEAIRAREDELANAIAARERAAIETFLAPDFRVGPDATLGADEWVAELLGDCGSGRMELQNPQILVTGDLAVASFGLTTRRGPACNPPALRSTVSDVWVRTAGTWRLALRTVTNVQSATSPGALLVPPEWSGTTELTILSTAGNVDTFTIGLAAEVIWQRGPWRTNSLSRFIRTTSADQEQARALNIEVRQSRRLSPRTELIARTIYDRDKFAGIEHRFSVDGSLGVTVGPESHNMLLTLGAGGIREVRLTTGTRTFSTGTSGLHYRLAVTPNTIVTNDLAATSSLQQASNWRMDNTAAVTAVLRNPLSLKLSYGVKYLNLPVPGFEPVDTIVSAALVAKF